MTHIISNRNLLSIDTMQSEHRIQIIGPNSAVKGGLASMSYVE